MTDAANPVVPVNAGTQKPKKFTWRGLGILLCTFAIVLMILAIGYGYRKLVEINIFLAQAYTKLEVQLGQQQNQINMLQTQLTKTENQNNQLQAALSAQTQAVNQWRNQQQNPQASWSVLEAQYLVKVANDNLNLNHNIPVALAALKSADELLQKLQDPNVESIRRALISDMDHLQSAAVVDTTGLYLRLSVLDQKINQLPLLSEQNVTQTTVEQPRLVNESWWKRGLADTGKVLEQLVHVRYNPPNTIPFLLPEQKNYLYQNLHAELAQAMWAVLNSNDAVYKNSLSQAAAWIKQYFNLSNTETQSTLNQLAELQQVTLQPSTVSITASVQAFRQYFELPQKNAQ